MLSSSLRLKAIFDGLLRVMVLHRDVTREMFLLVRLPLTYIITASSMFSDKR
jgi:hypothetical protein